MNSMNLSKNKWLVVIFHVMVWGTLFGFPYLLTSGQGSTLHKIMQHSWIPLIGYMIIFYVNYSLLIERLLFRKKILLYILLNLLLSGGLVFATVLVRMAFFRMEGENHLPPPLPLQFFFYMEFLSALIPLFFSIALRILSRWMQTRANEQEQAAYRFQTELQHLKYQLQPHFFFNSLNNIYSLVDRSPEKAKENIHALGKLMRYFLYESDTELVKLSNEIEFMKKYIELMEVRTADRTKVFVKFEEISQDVLIPPLLFISLIENAFKHGTSAKEITPLLFQLQITNNQLLFTSRNAHLPKSKEDHSGSGIGLNNLEKRLQLLYPENHSFERRIENGQFIVELSIHLDGLHHEK